MPSKTILNAATSRKALIATFLPALASAAAFSASPASAQSVCVIEPGGIIDCSAPLPPPPGSPPGTPPTTGSIDLTSSPDPLTVTLAEGFISNGPFTLGTIGGGDIDIVSSGVSTIQSTGPGLVADSSGSLNAQISNVTTSGDSATGVLLRAVDDIIFTSDGTIATTGANADAVNAEGGTVTLDLTNVSTTGPSSNGVEAGSLNGPTIVTFDVINTSGDGSTGAIIRSTGDSSLSGNAIRTGGTEAAAFDISNDAAACIVLGAGGCDNTVTLDEVTTEGFGSTGGLVSSTGDTNINIGVLRTGGDEAAGLNLSANPESCAVIGTGACDTAFTVNELSTAGDRSPGAIVSGAGDIDANVGLLRTEGDESAGLVLSSNPEACAILGAGGCDTSFSVGELTTSGDGSTGALIRSSGDTNGSVGVLRTEGNDAAGIDVASDPDTCVLLGAGACDVGLAADDVSTSGDGAAAVLIDSSGAIVTDLGRLATQGDDSAGLGINQDPAVCLAIGPGSCSVDAAADDVSTEGDNSPGIDIASPGPVNVDAGEVTTGGDNSDGIRIVGGDALVTVDVGAVTTTGADSDGIDLATVNGDISILAGPVRVSGPGADAIVAASLCGNIDITARDDVVSAQGNAILASSGCGVSVTTLPGAAVAGNTAGITVTSGTGALITIGDTVSAANGPAIDADGAAAAVIVTPTGMVNGWVDLTGNADTLDNDGQLNLVGTSDFGAGADLLTNGGIVRANGAVALAGLESFVNTGEIDLADGAPDDVLTIPGNFTGGTGSTLSVDVAAGIAGTPVDRLVVGGAVSGTTAVTLNLVGGPSVVNPNGALLVDASSSAPGAFTLAGPVRSGLVDYSILTAGADALLIALPNEIAIEPLLVSGIGHDFWYQSADAWSESAALRRSNLGSERPRGASFWVQGYGGSDKKGDSREIDVFGTVRDTNLRLETERRGVQAGVDFSPGPGGFALGVTGGYEHAETDLASGTGVHVEGHNIGAYLLYAGASGFYGELLAKADFFDVRVDNGVLFAPGEIDGKSYGVEGELGYRLGMGALHVDLNAGLAYVRTSLDDLEGAGVRFEFDRATSLRGRLGVRVGGTGDFAPYADVKLLHEFKGENETALQSGGFTLGLTDHGTGTWVRGEVGLAGSPAKSGGFVSAWGEAGDVKGYGLRLGFRW